MVTSSSPIRIPLAVALVALTLILGARAMAQAPAAEAQQAEAVPGSIYSMLLEHPNFVSITILLLSIVAVTLIIQAFIRVRRPVLLPQESTSTLREMIGNRQFKELLDYTEGDPSFVSRALNPALKRAPSFSAMKEAMETSVAEQTAEEFRRLEYLNILANVGPLLGLLGTVIGIMQAFLQMRIEGAAANPASLAGGISVALGTTMLGLMLAIPCLVAYGVLRTKVDRLTTDGAMEAEELLLMIRPAEAKTSSTSLSSASRQTGSSRSASSSRRSIPTTPPAPPSPPAVGKA